MIRRVVLLVGSFAVLLGAFWGYRLATRITTAPAGLFGSTAAEHQAPITAGAGEGIPDVPWSEKVKFWRRGDDGRLRSIYSAERWDKVDDRHYRLTEPRVELFLKGGQEVHIRSDSGMITTDGTLRNPPSRISLEGDVRIDLDRFTGPSREPLDERPDDRVRICMDRVSFDNSLLRIETNSKVTVESAEANVYGRGLLITWHEAPHRELDILRIEQGERILLKNLSQDMDIVALPKAGKSGEAEVQEAPGAKAPATATAAAPVAERPATSPATQPAPMKNVYLAEFFDNGGRLEVVSGERVIRGARKMTLKFDWDRSFTERLDREQTPKAATAPATRPSRAPAAAAAPARPEAPKTMTVLWMGPFVLRPVGHTPSPSRDRYTVTAEGEEVLLADAETQAACNAFSFTRDKADAGGAVQSAGRLTGTEDDPVVLTLSGGSRAVCPVMRIDQAAGRAYLDGRGHMISRSGTADIAAVRPARSRTTQPATQPASEKPPARIDWSEGVVATFVERQVRTEDGSVRGRQDLDEAVFRGDVRLEQGGTEEYLTCDELTAKMARGAQGQLYPRTAVAEGHVVGRQEGSDIRADRLTVHFEQVRAEPRADGKPRSELRASRMEADGSVVVTDRRGDEPMTATADALESDLVRRIATLRGRPGRNAEVAQGDNRLASEEIVIYELTGRDSERDLEVRATGKGRLDFTTRKDLEGRELAQPRPIRVAWSRSMNYQGPRDLVVFDGSVRLDSGEQHMECRTMYLYLSRVEEEPSTQPVVESTGERRPQRGLALGVEEYGKRRIRLIQADRDVVLRSREVVDERLHRRFQVTGQKLIYDAEMKRVNIDGKGTLVAEDYRPPKPRRPDERTEGAVGLFAGDVDRPNQTVLRWQEFMELLQDDRQVTVDGDVILRHVSGKNVVLAGGLNTPDWGELESGRTMDIRCEKLMAWFAEEGVEARPTAPTTRPAEVPDLGPRIGRLTQFSASRRVLMRYDKAEAIGERVLYTRPDEGDEMATLWGHLPGERPANAQLTYEDAETGRFQTVASPKIIWFPKNNRIVTDKTIGTGGR